MLGSLICLSSFFVRHPYDVGDKVIINKETLVVKEMNLMSTLFVKSNGSDVVMLNEVLSKLPIDNINRSGYQVDQFPILIPYSTVTSESLDAVMVLIKDKMQEFVNSQPRDFVTNSILVESKSVDIKENVIELRLSVRHKSNFQDKERTIERRNKVHCPLSLYIVYTYIPFNPLAF
jgi:small-conductance mechanosensitive channel